MSTSQLRSILLASLGSMSLVAGCGPAPRATPSPAPATAARPAPTASEKPPVTSDVDAAAVTRQCAKIAAQQHAALDTLAKKGVPAAKIAAAKELFGKCQPVGKAALVLTIDELDAANTPAEQDPICSRGTVHPSSLAGFGCFDPPCNDCIQGNLMMNLVALPFSSAPRSIGPIAPVTGFRAHSDDGGDYRIGTSIATLRGAIKGSFDVDADGWPELLHCGTIHDLQGDRPTMTTLREEACTLLSTEPSGFGPSITATAIADSLTGRFRMTASGPELAVVQADLRGECGENPDARLHCTGPTLWSRYKDGAFVAPLEGPDPELWSRFVEQCREAAAQKGGESPFGSSVPARIIEKEFCKALPAGKLPPEDLGDRTLAAYCGGGCPAESTIRIIYGATRAMLEAQRPPSRP
jgi:hypothetical protein